MENYEKSLFVVNVQKTGFLQKLSSLKNSIDFNHDWLFVKKSTYKELMLALWDSNLVHGTNLNADSVRWSRTHIVNIFREREKKLKLN